MKKENFKIFVFVLLVILIINFLNIRVCVFYNIFGIPCPACGMTRAFNRIFMLKIKESFDYNLLGVPLFIIINSYLIINFYSILKNTDEINIYFEKFFQKYKTALIIISAVIVILNWIRNLYNPLLY
ncbi:DUF2752 domain-containing protein [Parvimonas parva]|uniref:DUF2752 domain-containing protein n=1 Tax=Parvimonas parva TaxID=2769485 RepID=A0ABS1C6Y4_9FIRM|nr:DUF2752 domain-containing protein [Parvimonas parva]MBK1467851.1 DUF2752 domain-containing protein [Parvimonas parva]